MNLHLVLLIAYSVGLILLGVGIGRVVRRSSDFFVAGRRLGPSLLFSTFLAANIGAGSTVGATSLGYRDGLSAWWWNGSAGLGSLLLAFWIGPRIWRLAAREGFYTVGDFLEYRYGRGVRAIIAVLIWLGTLSILAAQLLGVAAVLEVVGGVPTQVGCVIGGIVVTAYFVSGGLISSAWVNRAQLCVLLGGFAVALPLVVSSVGGWTAIRAAPAPEGFLDVWYSSGAGSGWTFMALLVPAFIVSPGLLQKAYGARNERTVKLGIGVNGAVLLVFAFVPTLLGMAARTHYPDLPNPDLALPTVLTGTLPPGLGALALAAAFSAEASSADAVLFMLATSLSQDLYRRFLEPGATDARLLAVARGGAIVGGAAGVAIALVYDTVVGAMSVFYALLGVSLFVPVLAGLYSRRGGTPEAIAAIGSGTAVLLAVHVATGGRGIGLWTPNLIGLLAAAVGFALVLIARRGATTGRTIG